MARTLGTGTLSTSSPLRTTASPTATFSSYRTTPSTASSFVNSDTLRVMYPKLINDVYGNPVVVNNAQEEAIALGNYSQVPGSGDTRTASGNIFEDAWDWVGDTWSDIGDVATDIIPGLDFVPGWGDGPQQTGWASPTTTTFPQYSGPIVSTATGVQSATPITDRSYTSIPGGISGLAERQTQDPNYVRPDDLTQNLIEQRQQNPGTVPDSLSRVDPGQEGTSAFPGYTIADIPDETITTYPTSPGSPQTPIAPPGAGQQPPFVPGGLTGVNYLKWAVENYGPWMNQGVAPQGVYHWRLPSREAFDQTLTQAQSDYDRAQRSLSDASNAQEEQWAWQDYNRALIGSSLGLGKYSNLTPLDPLAQLQGQLQQQYNPNFMDSLTGQQDFSGLFRQRQQALGQQLNQQAAGMGVQGAYSGLLGEQQRARDALASRAQAAYNPLAIQTQQQYRQSSDELLNAINQAEMEAQRVFATSGV